MEASHGSLKALLGHKHRTYRHHGPCIEDMELLDFCQPGHYLCDGIPMDFCAQDSTPERWVFRVRTRPDTDTSVTIHATTTLSEDDRERHHLHNVEIRFALFPRLLGYRRNELVIYEKGWEPEQDEEGSFHLKRHRLTVV